jgi:hypothetical protein
MWELSRIILPGTREINFSNPFKGRRWLQLLQPHARYGMTFIPNLDVPSTKLGFSFRSNEHGLRGPANVLAPGVIMGTSFAMGLSVDNGKNWYDQLDQNAWFNTGMPVGPANTRAVLDELYRGKGEILLFLYHPNIWKTAVGFVAAEAAQKDIFAQMGWRTDFLYTATRYPVWLVAEVEKVRRGRAIYTTWDRQPFFLNTVYNFIDPGVHEVFLCEQMTILNDIFSRFDNVVVIRTPIKEDSVPETMVTPRLQALRENYDALWTFFQSSVSEHVRINPINHSDFTVNDFLGFDTHWSAAGNQKFAQIVGSALGQTAHVSAVGAFDR